MKVIKIVTAALLVVLMVILSVSCSSSSSAASATSTSTYTVKTGDIATTVTGTGNLAYSKTEDLAFEIDGYVASVDVSASDSVKKGQEIASVDTTTWNSTLESLQNAVTSAQRTLTQEQSTLAADQRAVTDAQLVVTAAQVALQKAQWSLENESSVKSAQDAADSAEASLNYALAARKAGDYTMNTEYLSDLQTAYDNAETALQNLLTGKSITVTTSVELEIAQDQVAVAQAQAALNDDNAKVDEANLSVTLAQQQVDTDTQSLKDAQTALDEANAKSPVVKAPFDGIITSVKVSGGDEVYKGTVAVQIADTTQFEAITYVSEDDVLNVKVGSTATVSVDAVSDSSYPATISAIAPLATESSGVVEYQVTAELTSSDAVSALKSGLSATINIILQQESDVLLVPTRAITHVGGNATVQVVSGTTTTTQIIQTGITDGTYTEVTSGLKAGQVILSKGTTTTSSSSKTTTTTTSSNQGGGGMMGGPGMGGMP